MKMNEVVDFLNKVKVYAEKLIDGMVEGKYTLIQLSDNVSNNVSILDDIKNVLPIQIYGAYEEFFSEFKKMCSLSRDVEFFDNNAELILSSYDLYVECIDAIITEYESKLRKCPYCNKEVIYRPLDSYYTIMAERYNSIKSVPETLNKEEYDCPCCGSNDRDRMIIKFLEKVGLRNAAEHSKVLQIAPSKVIDTYIKTRCPHIDYDTTDLFMQGVTFKSDIQNMVDVPDEKYDVIICSHVLEHVEDDKKALAELKRILKADGILVFLVPVDISSDDIDEEWGLSEAENWRRFGQNDHCRRYGKKGLISRIEECGWYINSLGKEYFGDETFKELGLIDTSVLYVLTKDEEVKLDRKYHIECSKELLENGPLVSVIMSCYNHEQYVAETIESVINQTYKNIEFLVADDASSDNSVEVMKRYSKYYAGEYYYDTNYGSRIWDLFEKTTGKYVAMINSDDVWDKDKIALQVKYLEEHEDVLACFTYCDYADENMNIIPSETFYVKNKNRYEWMEHFWRVGNCLCYPSILIRREVYADLFKSKKVCRQLADFFQWVDLVQMGEIYVIPRSLIKMRRYNNNKVCNMSDISVDNMTRDFMESMTHWMYEIEEMDGQFFANAFRKHFVREDADTEEELVCEKFFLMYNSPRRWIQNNAFYYYMSVVRNDAVRKCFENKYNFSIKEIFASIISKGFGEYVKEEVKKKLKN